MNTIETALLAFFSQRANHTIIVAYSGGVDSQVLLAALSKLKRQEKLCQPIKVCHVNHGLSANAPSWQDFATAQCQQFSLPLTIHQLALKKLPQQSLEAIARDARYQCLIDSSDEPAFIVTGHHLNDQTETFLLALKRGAGLKGLSAMSAQTQLAQHTLVRPLLNIAREDIVNYAKQHELAWIEDESNQDQAFDRNFLRYTIIPELTARWPSFNNTLSRSVSHCQDAQTLIDELAQEDFTKVSINEKVLSIPALLNLSALRFNNVIRYFLARHDKLMPSRAQLAQVAQQISAQSDKNPFVKINDYCLRRYQQQLFLTDDFDNITEWKREIAINAGGDIIKLPDNLGIVQCDVTQAIAADLVVNRDTCFNHTLGESKELRIKAPEAGQIVRVCFSHNNPKCLPHFRDKSRALKKVLQEEKIPTWQRQRIPFIYYDETLVAALGLFVCKSYLPQQDSGMLKLVWLENK